MCWYIIKLLEMELAYVMVLSCVMVLVHVVVLCCVSPLWMGRWVLRSQKKLLEIRNQELFGTRNTSCTIAYLIQEDVSLSLGAGDHSNTQKHTISLTTLISKWNIFRKIQQKGLCEALSFKLILDLVTLDAKNSHS